MRKILIVLFIFLLSVGVWQAWHRLSPKPSEKQSIEEISYYTCPMHPQIHKDGPGNCPICGMTLVPVYKHSHTETEIQNSNAASTISISAEKQQLIGLTTAIVSKKKISAHLLSPNAFDTVLSVAQSEYVEILKNAPDLKKAARKRLKILGMSESAISELENPKKNKNPSASANASEGLVIPQSAIVNTGTERFVFVITNGQNFEKRIIKIGGESEAEVIVTEGVSEGEIVATNALFLIDSESELKKGL